MDALKTIAADSVKAEVPVFGLGDTVFFVQDGIAAGNCDVGEGRYHGGHTFCPIVLCASGN